MRPTLTARQKWGVALMLALGGHALMLTGTGEEELRPMLLVGSALAMAGMIAGWKLGVPGLAWVLGIGIVLRAIMVPAPPVLSTDAYRYLWDGWLSVHGINPFQFVPSDPALAAFQASPLYGHLVTRDYYSVYPPVCQGVFAFSALALPMGIQPAYYLLKLSLGSCELVALFALARLLPVRQLMLYAWNPLITLETWGQPHGEAIALGGLALTLFLLRRGSHPAVAVGALTVAGWAKLWPLLLLPFLWRKLGWRWQYVAWAIGLTVLLWAPFASVDTFGHIGQSLRLYTHLFEWNAGIYYTATAIRWGLMWLFWKTGLIAEGSGTARIVAPMLGALFLGLVAWLFLKRGNWPFERQLAVVSFLFVLSLSTIHPWYLTPVLLVLPFFRPAEWSWFWLSLTSIGTYLYYTTGIYWPFVVAGWGGWLLLTLWNWRRHRQPLFAGLTPDA